jgi:hypothetical protein
VCPCLEPPQSQAWEALEALEGLHDL